MKRVLATVVALAAIVVLVVAALTVVGVCAVAPMNGVTV